MIVLDADVLIAHLESADPHHHAAAQLLDSVTDDELLIHTVNLAEVLVGGARVGRGRQMLHDLERLGVTVAPSDPEEPLRLAELRASAGLKLPDCCALSTAIATDSALATFDDAVTKAARVRHVEVLPIS